MASPPMMKPQTPPRAPERAAERIKTKTATSGAEKAKLPPLSKRLPVMTEAQLLAMQASAVRISADGNHPKQAAATRALPLVEAEIGRRAVSGEARQPAAANDE